MAATNSYDVEGTATLAELPDGGLVLRFGDDFKSSNGPNLAVYLSATNSVTSSSLKLGDLKATQGAQTYPVQADLDQYAYVIIHCVPFNVSFGSARLR